MLKTLWLALSLLAAVCCVAEAAPAGLGAWQLDDLNTDLDELAYEVEEEDIEDFAKLLDEAPSADEDTVKTNQPKKTTTSSGFKNKNTSKKGTKNNHNVQDLKKFFKSVRARDRGAYNDDDVYANANGVAAQAVGIKGKEDRKYRKGTKTRGFHRVHHKDEYKKDKVIYEDDETKGSINKVGAKALGYKIGAGAGVKRGHFHHDRHKDSNAKRAYLDKGITDREFKGYSDTQGFEAAFNDES